MHKVYIKLILSTQVYTSVEMSNKKKTLTRLDKVQCMAMIFMFESKFTRSGSVHVYRLIAPQERKDCVTASGPQCRRGCSRNGNAKSNCL